jgi:hypothetical protein
MSDRVKLARETAARTKPRFIEIKSERRTKLRRTNDWLFIEIPRERGGGTKCCSPRSSSRQCVAGRQSNSINLGLSGSLPQMSDPVHCNQCSQELIEIDNREQHLVAA